MSHIRCVFCPSWYIYHTHVRMNHFSHTLHVSHTHRRDILRAGLSKKWFHKYVMCMCVCDTYVICVFTYTYIHVSIYMYIYIYIYICIYIIIYISMSGGTYYVRGSQRSDFTIWNVADRLWGSSHGQTSRQKRQWVYRLWGFPQAFHWGARVLRITYVLCILYILYYTYCIYFI